jgi:hypothetical protein
MAQKSLTAAPVLPVRGRVASGNTEPDSNGNAEGLLAFARTLTPLRYVVHGDRDKYCFSQWTTLADATSVEHADVLSSRLLGTDDRHAILLDLDRDVAIEKDPPAGQTVIAILANGRNPGAPAPTGFGDSYSAARSLPTKRRFGPVWGITERYLRKLDRRLQAAGLGGVVTVAHRGQPLPDQDHEGRFYLELAFAGNVWIAESRTPGHHHLYVDVPGGLTSKQYGKLRTVLYKANVIEQAHVRDDATYLRPPWMKKTSS